MAPRTRIRTFLAIGFIAAVVIAVGFATANRGQKGTVAVTTGMTATDSTTTSSGVTTSRSVTTSSKAPKR